MTTDLPGPPPAEPGHDGETHELVFATHDLGREDDATAHGGAPPTFVVMDGAVAQKVEAPLVAGTPSGPGAPSSGIDAPAVSPVRSGFHVTSGTAPAVAVQADAVPWMVRGEEPAAVVDVPAASRYTDVLERTAEATVRRLRQDAVQVSWTAAWHAVTAADTKRRPRGGA